MQFGKLETSFVWSISILLAEFCLVFGPNDDHDYEHIAKLSQFHGNLVSQHNKLLPVWFCRFLPRRMNFVPTKTALNVWNLHAHNLCGLSSRPARKSNLSNYVCIALQNTGPKCLTGNKTLFKHQWFPHLCKSDYIEALQTKAELGRTGQRPKKLNRLRKW